MRRRAAGGSRPCHMAAPARRHLPLRWRQLDQLDWPRRLPPQLPALLSGLPLLRLLLLRLLLLLLRLQPLPPLR
jgi:hypothetical protein